MSVQHAAHVILNFVLYFTGISQLNYTRHGTELKVCALKKMSTIMTECTLLISFWAGQSCLNVPHDDDTNLCVYGSFPTFFLFFFFLQKQ